MSRRSTPAFGAPTGQAALDQTELVQSSRAALAAFGQDLEAGRLRPNQHASLLRLQAALAPFSADSRPLSIGEIVGSYREIPIAGGRVS